MPDHRLILDKIAVSCKKCKACSLGHFKAKAQYQEYDPHVSGWRDWVPFVPNIMIVGQNPSWDDVVLGKPLSGLIGDNLDKAFREYGSRYLIDRNSFYITHAVKCFTDVNNSAPTSKSIDACQSFLKMEIAVIKPILILAIGNIAFNALCPDLSFNDYVGKIVKSSAYGVKVYCTQYPPSEQFFKSIKMLCELMFRADCPW